MIKLLPLELTAVSQLETIWRYRFLANNRKGTGGEF